MAKWSICNYLHCNYSTLGGKKKKKQNRLLHKCAQCLSKQKPCACTLVGESHSRLLTHYEAKYQNDKQKKQKMAARCNYRRVFPRLGLTTQMDFPRQREEKEYKGTFCIPLTEMSPSPQHWRTQSQLLIRGCWRNVAVATTLPWGSTLRSCS